jgi:protein TonB
VHLRRRPKTSKQIAHVVLTLVGGAALSLFFFLVLPLLQEISKGPRPDLEIVSFDTGSIEEPEQPEIEEEPEPEPEPEPEQPKLEAEPEELSLSQLELALNPSGGAFGGADFAIQLSTSGGGGDGDEGFSLGELDQKPRPIYYPSPQLDASARSKTPGSCTVIFLVDERGRVEKAKVQSSTDPVFERPSLEAIRKWKFEPGQRGGKPATFSTRQSFTFPKT